MREYNRLRRQAQIEQAAYDLLDQHGYSGTSMQGIARKAQASNETLYKWYGDKKGLFIALVERNTTDVKAYLETELSSGHTTFAVLENLGPKLLSLVLGNRAVALNRAAVADPSGDLSDAISRAGREVVMPLLVKVFENGRKHKDLECADPEEAAGLYINLLVGDLQIRRVIGRFPEPTDEFCAQRTGKALSFLKKLLTD